MIAAPTPDKISRDKYVEGVLEWLKGVTQTPEGERYTPSATPSSIRQICEKEGLPVAPAQYFREYRAE